MAYDSVTKTYYSPTTKYNPTTQNKTVYASKDITQTNVYGTPNFNPGYGAQNVQYQDESGQVHSGVYVSESGQILAPGEKVSGRNDIPVYEQRQEQGQLTYQNYFPQGEGFSYLGENYLGEAATVKLAQLKEQGADLSQLGELKLKERKRLGIAARGVAGLSNLPFLRRYRKTQGIEKTMSAGYDNREYVKGKYWTPPETKKPDFLSIGASNLGVVNKQRLSEGKQPLGARAQPTPTTTKIPEITEPTISREEFNIAVGLPTIGAFGIKNPGLLKEKGYDISAAPTPYKTGTILLTPKQPDMSSVDKALSKFGSNKFMEENDILLTPVFTGAKNAYRNAEYQRQLDLIKAEDNQTLIADANKRYEQSIKDISNPLAINITPDLGMKYSKNFLEEIAQRAANIDIPGIDVKTSPVTQGILSAGYIGLNPVGAMVGSVLGGQLFKASKKITPEGIPLAQLIGLGAGNYLKDIGLSKLTKYTTASISSQAARSSGIYKVGGEEAASTIVKPVQVGEGLKVVEKNPFNSLGTGKGVKVGKEIPIPVVVKNILGQSKTIETTRAFSGLKTQEAGAGGSISKASLRKFQPEEIRLTGLRTIKTEYTPRFNSMSKTISKNLPSASQDVIAQSYSKLGKVKEFITGGYRGTLTSKKTLGSGTRGTSLTDTFLETNAKIKSLELPAGEGISTRFKAYVYEGKTLTGKQVRINVGRTSRQISEHRIDSIERAMARIGAYKVNVNLERVSEFSKDLDASLNKFDLVKKRGGGSSGRINIRDSDLGGGLKVLQLEKQRNQVSPAMMELVSRGEGALKTANKYSMSASLQKSMLSSALISSKPISRLSQRMEYKTFTIPKTSTRQDMILLQLPKSKQEQKQTSRMNQESLTLPKQLIQSMQKQEQNTRQIQIPRQSIIPVALTQNLLVSVPPGIGGGVKIPPFGLGGEGQNFSGRRGYGKRFYLINQKIKTVKQVKGMGKIRMPALKKIKLGGK